MNFGKKHLVLLAILILAGALTPTRTQTPSRVPASQRQPSICGDHAYQKICRRAAMIMDERHGSLIQEGNRLATKIDRAFDLHKSDVDARVGKLRDHLGDEDFFKTWVLEMDRAITQEIIRPSEAEQVLRNLQHLTQQFIETISDAGLPPRSVETLQSLFNSCPAQVNLRISRQSGLRWATTQNLRNAVVTAAFSAQPQRFLERRHGAEVSIKEGTPCTILLDGVTWRECRDETAECAFIYFHELSHFLNPCKFHPNYHEIAATNTRRHRRAARDLAQTGEILWARTSCLDQTLNPQEALNRSTGAQYLADSYEGRCTIDNEYPSQWDESQADLWGSLAFAKWIERLPAREKTEVATTSMGQFCPEVQANTTSIRTQYGQFLDREFLHTIVEHRPDVPYVPTPAGVELPEPWFNSHPTWQARIEDIYLRNPRLRSVLGCEPTTPSCSPERNR